MTRGTYHISIMKIAGPSSMTHMAIRATADELLKEYKACESPDYISYVRECPSHSLSCVTVIVRGPTMANKPVNETNLDVYKTYFVYVLIDIPTECISLLSLSAYRVMATMK
jgi:hypothetical protein